tara:strand:+ start:336 stop:1418 length:1083 start_codon:yes stop_codon:yes gene_type:complete
MGLNEKFFKTSAADDTLNFNTVIWDGNNTARTIPVGFQPDLIWLKCRNNSTYSSLRHLWYDSVRTVGAGYIHSDGNSAQEVYAAVSSFASTGFNLPQSTADTAEGAMNDGAGGGTYVGWCWKAAGFANAFNVLENGIVTTSSSATTAGVTAGSITTGWNVSANRDAGFSIVKYTGNENSNQTVGHGLSEKPQLAFIKQLDGTREWVVPTLDVASGRYLVLSEDNAIGVDTARWSSISTSTITIGASPFTNGSGSPYIAYFFHSVTGYSKVGEYNGAAGANKQTLDFEPRFVMVKRHDQTGSWNIWDAERGTNKRLYPDLTQAEGTDSPARINFLSDGFSFYNNGSGYNNTSGSYIYLAIA